MANKLELTWYGKDEPILVEPRLLIENAALSNTAADPDTENMLIHGDNLLALKALESKYAGQVKCIYIDPPYNTGSAFEHYDDNLEHSQWLQLIRPRLEILWRLLSENGSFWISIDDDERDCFYFLVSCKAFVTLITDTSPPNGIIILGRPAVDYSGIFMTAKRAFHQEFPPQYRCFVLNNV